MRNRVSFSYVNPYSTSYQAYSNTVFIDHNLTDVWKDKVKYTYIGKTNWSYIHHGLGTSYAYTNGSTEKLTLFENNYGDRYRYVIDSNIENNKREIHQKFYKNLVPIQENIYTYIEIGNNTYSPFPNFIEGITNQEYTYYKLAYGCSTNNLVAEWDTKTFGSTEYGEHISLNPLNIISNIRGTLDNGKRIIGIGFDDNINETAMYAGLEYTSILTVYIYDEDMEQIANTDVFNGLTIELPGVESDVYEVTKSPSTATNKAVLSIKEINKHIGNVLVKITLDWKNNKYTLYKTLNFANIINKINNINAIYYSVNNNDRDSSNWHSQLLEGDLINVAYITTIPERANNTVTLQINDHLSTAYNGSCEKRNHSSAPFEYNFEYNSDIITVSSISNNYENLDNEITYNTNDTKNINTKIFKFVPSNKNFKYRDSNNVYHQFSIDEGTTSTTSIEMSDAQNTDKMKIYGVFDIAKYDNEKYSHKITKNGEYNNVAVYYIYNTGHNANDPYHYNLTSPELKYDTVNKYNSYSFSHNIENPGQYEFKCLTKNGTVTENDTLHIFNYWNTTQISEHITLFEGIVNYPLLDNDIINSYNVISYTAENLPHSVNTENCTLSLGSFPIISESPNGLFSMYPVTFECRNSNNDYIRIIGNYNVRIHKFFIKTEIRINNGSPFMIGDHMTPQDSITLNNDNLDISKYDSNEVNIQIISSIHLKRSGNADDYDQSPCNNFELSAELITANWNKPGFSNINIGTENNKSIISFTVNRNDWYSQNNTETSYDLEYTIHLKRKSEYEDLNVYEFKPVNNYTITISNTQQQVDNYNIPNMLLLTNVVDVNGNNAFEYTFINDTLGAGLDNIEQLVIGGDNYNALLTISQRVENNKAIISFVPTLNNNIDTVLNLTVKPQNSQTTKQFKVWLKNASIEFNSSISPRHYIEDINDNTKKLYQEILLSSSMSGDCSNDSTFINTFCGNYNLLSKYTFNNGLILFVKNTVERDDTMFTANNVSNGIKFTFNNTNLMYDETNRTLIPLSTTGVKIIMEHNNVEFVNKSITMEKMDVNQDIKLFTNGENNSSNPS